MYINVKLPSKNLNPILISLSQECVMVEMQKFKDSFVGVKHGGEKMKKRKVERKLIL